MVKEAHPLRINLCYLFVVGGAVAEAGRLKTAASRVK